MRKQKVIEDTQWHIPYAKADISDIYELAYNQALLDVLARCSGEVINGVLVPAIKAETIKEMLDEPIK